MLHLALALKFGRTVNVENNWGVSGRRGEARAVLIDVKSFSVVNGVAWYTTSESQIRNNFIAG